MRNLTQDLSPLESYLHQLYPQEPSAFFQTARSTALALNKGAISLSPAEARLLSFLIRSHGCKKFVEIGTLTGTSALWILHGLHHEGTLWTFEKEALHAKAAKAILKDYQRHQGSQKVHVIEGDAALKLNSIEDEGPFDGIFIDGNKSAYGLYLDWAEMNLKKGALLIADNIFLGGAVVTGNSAQFSKKQIGIMREFNRRLADSEKYQSAIVPTGDGLFVAIKK